MHRATTTHRMHNAFISLACILSIFADLTTNVRVDGRDLRDNIIAGNETGFAYSAADLLFHLTESVNIGPQMRIGCMDYLSLNESEVFDGNGRQIFVHCSNFLGFFTADGGLSGTINEAAKITNTHFQQEGNATGLLLRDKQKNVIVDSCSAEIEGKILLGGGGICGRDCATFGGHIQINNSRFTGEIGERSGGILGKYSGSKGGKINIYRCSVHSNLVGYRGGGICGEGCGSSRGYVQVMESQFSGIIGHYAGGILGPEAGHTNGIVYVSGCNAGGKLLGWYAGGICGPSIAHGCGSAYVSRSFFTGHIGGYSSFGLGAGGIVGGVLKDGPSWIHVSECYVLGGVDAAWAGGICGAFVEAGNVTITASDSFTAGAIADGAGGICGSNIGYKGSDVHIYNTYAMGPFGMDAGGIAESVHKTAANVTIIHSVHSAQQITSVSSVHRIAIERGNSDTLNDIRGKLYAPHGTAVWSNEKWTVYSPLKPPTLRFNVGAFVSPTPSPTSSVTPTRAATLPGSPSPYATPFLRNTLSIPAQMPKRQIRNRSKRKQTPTGQ
eukprot:gb/GECG01008540.1/.p1 GENE.gb/GECG01008540.1/~~gb/GECG01008540.1/.p1  ORF type:complete len:554 (+),score=35.80 gb/GECG01008540.1/:1-1662(+)